MSVLLFRLATPAGGALHPSGHATADAQPPPPAVSVAEIVENPERFVSRRVSVVGYAATGFEFSFLAQSPADMEAVFERMAERRRVGTLPVRVLGLRPSERAPDDVFRYPGQRVLVGGTVVAPSLRGVDRGAVGASLEVDEISPLPLRRCASSSGTCERV
jgi:hypothetical protein